jgi:outer membrane assembly lipoprotein YfiO
MRQKTRSDQGRSRWGLWVLVGAGLLALASPAGAQQRHDLEDGGWVQQPAHAPDSPEGQLDAIRKTIAQGDGKQAKHAADEWIEANDGHVLMPQALLIRGDANVTREHFFKSLFDYERVIREYPGSEQFHTAQLREFELAKLFMAGTKRRLWGMRVLPATDEAEEILVRIQERSPGGDLGELASMTLADFYFNKPQMDTAADAYDMFLVNYPKSERKEWAMLRLIQANLARFKGPRFDATGLIDAGQRLKTYRAEYPSSAERMGVDALLIRIDESLAMRDMVAADWHVQRKQLNSAIYLYRRVIEDYPRTAAAQDAIRTLRNLGIEPVPVDEASAPPPASVTAETAVTMPMPEPTEPAAVDPEPVPAAEIATEPEAPLTDVAEAQPGELPTEPEPVLEPVPELEPEPETEPETESVPATAPEQPQPLPEKP